MKNTKNIGFIHYRVYHDENNYIYDANVAYDNLSGVEENLDNCNLVLDTVTEVENIINEANEINNDFNEV